MSIWLCSACASRVGTCAAVRLHQRHAGLVAGGFDAEDDHRTSVCGPPRRDRLSRPAQQCCEGVGASTTTTQHGRPTTDSTPRRASRSRPASSVTAAGRGRAVRQGMGRGGTGTICAIAGSAARACGTPRSRPPVHCRRRGSTETAGSAGRPGPRGPAPAAVASLPSRAAAVALADCSAGWRRPARARPPASAASGRCAGSRRRAWPCRSSGP